MGMFRDSSDQEIDIVNEMAESLGSTGIRLEEILEKTGEARDRAREMLGAYRDGVDRLEKPSLGDVNASIHEYNSWVEKAEDALRWLLIQREACGFRTHRNVDVFYPIPPRMKLLDS